MTHQTLGQEPGPNFTAPTMALNSLEAKMEPTTSNLHEMANAVVRAKERVDATKAEMDTARAEAEKTRVAHDNANIALEKAFRALAEKTGQDVVSGP